MTSTTTEETLILKTDVLGRVSMPADRREAILDRFEQSGMSGQAFARQVGVKCSTFATWIQKRRRKRGEYPEKAAPSPGITLVEAQWGQPSAPVAQGGALEVEATGGIKLMIRSQGDVVLAAQLLQSLGKARQC